MFNLETIAMLLLPSLLSLETNELSKFLDKQHENDANIHRGIVLTVAAWENGLEALVSKSVTKIDDTVLAANVAAIKANAEKHGILWPNN